MKTVELDSLSAFVHLKRVAKKEKTRKLLGVNTFFLRSTIVYLNAQDKTKTTSLRNFSKGLKCCLRLYILTFLTPLILKVKIYKSK